MATSPKRFGVSSIGLRKRSEAERESIRYDYESKIDALRAEHESELESLRSEYESRIEELERDIERLRNEKQMLIEDRVERNELVRYVEEERSLATQKAQAGSPRARNGG